MAKPRAARIASPTMPSRTDSRRFVAGWAWKVGRIMAMSTVWGLRPGVHAPQRPAASAQAQVDLRDLGGFGLGLEEVALQEPEHPREHVARELLDAVVVVEDGRVVVLAAERDLVLGRGQLLLERQDVLVG